MPVAFAGKMQRQQFQHAGAVERKALVQAVILEPLARPTPQGAAQPAVDRHREALLRSVDDLARQVAVREAPEQIFALPAAQLPFERQLKAPFDELVVEQRLARL